MPEMAAATGVADTSAVGSGTDTSASTVTDVSTQAAPEIEATGSITDPGVDDIGLQDDSADPNATPVKGDLRSVLKDPAKREALKAIDPSLPGLLRDALHGRESLTREFPGGLKEALEYKQMVHVMGGREGMEEVKATANDFQNLDALYTEGKPEFVERIATGDPEAFARMVPLAVDHFSKSNPDEYNHIFSRIMVNTFDSAGLSNALRGLFQSASEESKPIVKEIFDYIEGFRQMAAKVPEKKIDPERQKFETEKTEFQQKQIQTLVRDVDKQSISHRDSVIAREIKPFGDWETMEPERKDAVSAWVSQRIGKVLSADNGFLERRNRLIQNGDREGLAKLEQSKLDEMVPKLVPGAAKVFGVTLNKSAKPADKKAPVTSAKPTPKGVVMVKEQPKVIDRKRTTPDMIFKNQAYRPDGQLVQWP